MRLCHWQCVCAISLAAGAALACAKDSSGGPQVTLAAYKVLTPHSILVEAKGANSGNALDCTLSGEQPSSARASHSAAEVVWFFLNFESNVFEPDKKYVITCAVEGPDGKPVNPSDLIVDTTAQASAIKTRLPQQFDVISSVAFENDSAAAACSSGGTCVPSKVGRIDNETLPPNVKPDAPGAFSQARPPIPNTVFNESLTITFSKSGKAGPANPSSSSGTSTTSSGSKLVSASKDNSWFYANFNAIAGSGAAFAWGLNGFIDYPFQIKDTNWVIHPFSASANGGNNTNSIKGQTYTDTIDWGLQFTLLAGHRWFPHFAFSEFDIKPNYETDFEFDRKNFLGQLYGEFVVENNTQQREQARQQSSGADKSSCTKPGNPCFVGGEFDFQVGMEGGGALEATIQKPTKGNAAPVTIPTYSIARFATVPHGKFQIWYFSFEDSFTGRYLALTENSASQSKTYVVYPVQISGWKGINKLSASFAPSPTSNFSVTVTYTDGFDAPKFQRTNSVTAGLTVAIFKH